MPRYVLGIDAGTESIRTRIFDDTGKCHSFGVSENQNIHKQPGWGEQNIDQWDESLIKSIRNAFEGSDITPAHIYRGIMEGVVYGTQIILERMEEGGVHIDEIIACGGATESDLWMQIHADVTGKNIVIPAEQQAVSLGSAIAGMVGAGIFPDLATAADAVVKVGRIVTPDPGNTEKYREYVRQYEATYENLKEESRRLVKSLD